MRDGQYLFSSTWHIQSSNKTCSFYFFIISNPTVLICLLCYSSSPSSLFQAIPHQHQTNLLKTNSLKSLRDGMLLPAQGDMLTVSLKPLFAQPTPFYLGLVNSHFKTWLNFCFLKYFFWHHHHCPTTRSSTPVILFAVHF